MDWTLNPMERLETMPNEFYWLTNPTGLCFKSLGGPHVAAQALYVDQLGPEQLLGSEVVHVVIILHADQEYV